MLDGAHCKSNIHIFNCPIPGSESWTFDLRSFVEVVSVYRYTEELSLEIMHIYFLIKPVKTALPINPFDCDMTPESWNISIC